MAKLYCTHQLLHEPRSVQLRHGSTLLVCASVDVFRHVAAVAGGHNNRQVPPDGKHLQELHDVGVAPRQPVVLQFPQDVALVKGRDRVSVRQKFDGHLLIIPPIDCQLHEAAAAPLKVLFELVMLVSLQRVHGSIYVSPSAVHDRLRGRADAKRSGPARLPDTAPSAKLGPGAPGTEMCRDLSRSRVSSALRLCVKSSSTFGQVFLRRRSNSVSASGSSCARGWSWKIDDFTAEPIHLEIQPLMSREINGARDGQQRMCC
mmetsp:Transcript_2232/g.6633  ORF Transcript_2232/g.6633 Transcript_2232/m.6633 type:complete len:260 (+) Transcript_2232:2249-3028(+)